MASVSLDAAFMKVSGQLKEEMEPSVWQFRGGEFSWEYPTLNREFAAFKLDGPFVDP